MFNSLCRSSIAKHFAVNNAENSLNYGDKYIYKGIEGDEIIEEQLKKDAPCLIARYGSVELATIREFKRNKKNRKINIFSESQRCSMKNSAGFFPTENSALTRFACELIDISKHIDILGCWYRPYEREMCINYLPESAKLVTLANISPVQTQYNWTKSLSGKKVLVIHPFEDSIKKQYEKRELLFKDKDMIPEFELITFKPVQSIADNASLYKYNTWFEALNDMKNKIKDIDFDIALIGAGAYGIFLGAYCKSLGKKAVHMGGVLQLLFGIKGKRWDNCGLYNEHWIRPPESDKPLGAEKHDGRTFSYW